MGLLEAQEDLKKQLDVALAAEKTAETEEPKEEETPKEEPKEEPKEQPKEEPTDTDYARLRREAAAAKKKAQEEEQRRIEAEAKLTKEPEKDEYEYTETVNPEIQEMLQRHKMAKAEKEFMQLENNFAKTNPDYHDIAGAYAQTIAQSIYVQNPRLSQEEVHEVAKKTILMKASQFLNAGYDPIEELYHEAKQIGVKPQRKEEPKEEKKADLDKIAANKQRSSNMIAAKGMGEGRMTREHAATITNAEWAKLSASEKQRILRGQ